MGGLVQFFCSGFLQTYKRPEFEILYASACGMRSMLNVFKKIFFQELIEMQLIV